MPLSLKITKPLQTSTKRALLYCGCIGLSFLVITMFGFLPKTRAGENVLSPHQVSSAPTKIPYKSVATYSKLPLSFEMNQGQTDRTVRFLARGRGYALFLTRDEAVLALKKSSDASGPSAVGHRSLPPVLSGRARGIAKGSPRITDGGSRITEGVLRLRLVGANASASATGNDELPGRSNYFIGNDPKKWRTNVPNYAQVRYQDVYPGVDLVYYGNQGGQLEYDFVVAPGADPSVIALGACPRITDFS